MTSHDDFTTPTRIITKEEFRGEVGDGEVIFYVFRDGGDYGFIKPVKGDGSREKNIWFGERASQGEIFESGDLVSYGLNATSTEDRPRAHRVWHRTNGQKKITTLRGDLET